MKTDVLGLDGKKVKTIELPTQFDEEYEPNIIKRAVLAVLSKLRSPYGAYPDAGFRHSAKISRRRRNYKGSYGKGVSRVPRKILWRRGMQFGWAGAEVSGTVGGRRAHPPKSWKVWEHKINKKEKAKAMRSILSGLTQNNKMVVTIDAIENLKKSKEVQNAFAKLGFEKEFERLKEKSVRAGKGTMRGRKYKQKLGPMVVLSKECEAMKAINNLAGFETVIVDSLNANHLVKGYETLRHTIWSESAIEKIRKENLFAKK